MKASSCVPSGVFCGGEIEPGVFHGGKVEPGVFHSSGVSAHRPMNPDEPADPSPTEPQGDSAETPLRQPDGEFLE